MTTRPRRAGGLALVALILATPTARAADPVFWTSRDVKWEDAAVPEGARQAVLWTDPVSGDRATMIRWKFNSKNPKQTAAVDTHLVILAGTFTLDVEGQDQRQFGPGAFVSLPKGTTYESGCEAAGECTFVLHQPSSDRAAR